MPDLKVQGVVEMSTEDAGNQLDRLGDKAGSMAAKMQAGAEQAGSAVGKIGDGAQDSADKFTRAESRMAASIKRATDDLQLLGKTASEKLQFKIDDKGLDAAKFAPALEQLKALEAQQVKTGAAMAAGASTMNVYGMSAKQTANAMRLIPMQMTDIVTQLAGGQNPLLILTQQGGQLKDVFGGIGPALKGVGTYIASLVSPFTLAAAAASALFVAYEMGASASSKLNQSLILTGNYVGKTTGQLSDMASAIAGSTGSGLGGAVNALNQLVVSGKFAGDSLRSIATTAIEMSQVTGTSVSKIIDDLSKIADDPVAAAERLNDQYHFLTAATYEQIAALDRQNDKQAAATLLEQTYTQEMGRRTDEIKQHLSGLELAWNAVASAAKGAWNASMGTGMINSVEHQIDAIQGKIARFDANGGPLPGISSKNYQQLKDLLADKQSEQYASFINSQADAQFANIQTDGAHAIKVVQTILDQTVSKEQQRTKALLALHTELDKIKLSTPGSPLLFPENVKKAEQNVLDKYKDPKVPGFKDDAGTKMLQQLREQEAALNAQLDSSSKLTYAEKERAKFEQQIADIKTKGTLTVAQKSLLVDEAAIRAQLDKNVAVAQELKTKQEMIKVDTLRQSLAATLAADQQRFAEQLGAIGLGTRAQSEVAASLKIYSDYQRDIKKLQSDQTKNPIDAALYQQETDLLQKNLDDRLAAQKKYFADVRAAQADWRNGASEALQNYTDESNNAAKMTATTFTDGLKGMEDAFVSFAQTGKLSFTSMVNSIIADLARMTIKQNITGPLASGLNGVLGSLFGGAAAAQGTEGSGSSAMNLASMGKSVFDMFSGGFTTAGTAITQLGVKMGSQFVADFGYGFGGGANAGATSGGMAGVAGSYLAGAALGYTAGKFISGKFAAFGNANIANVGGVVIGSILGGPIGGAIGGAIGGVINRAFGMGPKEYGSTSIVGSVGGVVGFNGTMQTPWEQAGGWFSSGDSGVHVDPMAMAQSQALGTAFNQIRMGVAALATSVGTSADSLVNYSEQIKITLTDDASANQKLIDDTLSGVGERMITTLIPTINQYAKANETTTQTLQRLGSSLAGVNTGLALVHKSLLAISLDGADASSKLADVFGGLDNFSQASQAFYQAAYTDGERATNALQDMQTALQAVGVAMPDTMKQLRDMALALDLTTDAGRAAYAALISVAPTFAQATAVLLQQAQQVGAKLAAAFTGASGSVSAFDITALSDQIVTLGSNANAAAVDFAGLNSALADVDTDTFIAAVTTAFQTLAERVKGIINDINTERQAVRSAALQIIDPSVMTPAAIARAIGGINTTLPGNDAVVAAGNQLNAADALAAQRKAAEQAAGNAYNPALAAFNSAASQVGGLQSQYDSLASVIGGKEAEIAQPRKYSEGRKYVRDLQATMPALYDQLSQIGTALNAAKAASSPDKWNQVIALQSAYNQTVSDSASAQAAANTAATNAKAANTAYADALQAFAIDAGESVAKLANLREETVKYYQAQKALADLMGASATNLRKTVSDFRLSQLDPDQQFAQMRGDFAKNYSMALSTDGETLAGYADKLSASLSPLLEKAKDAFATDAQYNSFVAQTLARSEAIAGRLDTLAPSTYEDDSLGLLGQIDATLAALDESSQSASAIIAAAINAGRDATVNGLRQVTNALTGQPVAAFATGGDFPGGLRIVGENGPELEATGPSRIFNSVETRAILSGGGNDALVAEVRALRTEVANLNAAAMATAGNTGKIARQGDRNEIDGVLIRTESDSPILTVAA